MKQKTRFILSVIVALFVITGCNNETNEKSLNWSQKLDTITGLQADQILYEMYEKTWFSKRKEKIIAHYMSLDKPLVYLSQGNRFDYVHGWYLVFCKTGETAYKNEILGLIVHKYNDSFLLGILEDAMKEDNTLGVKILLLECNERFGTNVAKYLANIYCEKVHQDLLVEFVHNDNVHDIVTVEGLKRGVYIPQKGSYHNRRLSFFAN